MKKGSLTISWSSRKHLENFEKKESSGQLKDEETDNTHDCCIYHGGHLDAQIQRILCLIVSMLAETGVTDGSLGTG